MLLFKKIRGNSCQNFLRISPSFTRYYCFNSGVLPPWNISKMQKGRIQTAFARRLIHFPEGFRGLPQSYLRQGYFLHLHWKFGFTSKRSPLWHHGIEEYFLWTRKGFQADQVHLNFDCYLQESFPQTQTSGERVIVGKSTKVCFENSPLIYGNYQKFS